MPQTLSDEQLKALLKSRSPDLLDGLSPEDRKRADELMGVKRTEAKTAEKPPPPPRIPDALLMPKGKPQVVLPPATDLSPAGTSSNPFSAVAAGLKRAKESIPGAIGVTQQWGKSVLEFPGAFAVSVLDEAKETTVEGAKKKVSGVLDVLTRSPRAIIPGTKESLVAGNVMAALIPGTPQSQAGGALVAEVGKHEAKNILTFMSDPAKMAREEPGRAASAMLWLLPVGAAVTKSGIIRWGGKEVSMDALERAASVVDNNIGELALKMQRTMKKAGIEMTFDEAMEAVIGSDKTISMMRTAETPTARSFARGLEGAAQPHGMEKRWIREAGDAGALGFFEYRMLRMRENYLQRMADESARAFFGTDLSADVRSGMTTVLRGVHMGADGELKFGGIARADVLRIPTGKVKRAKFLQEHQPGTLLRGDDLNRVIGPVRTDNENFIQLYSLIDEESARARWSKLTTEYPEAEEVMRKLLALDEVPRITVGGDRLPAFSLSRLREQYKINSGLIGEEADHAQALVRQAYGPNALAKNQHLGFNYVPESVMHYDGLLGRVRNRLHQNSASVRLRKSGRAYSRELAGEQKFDIREGIIKAHKELVVEDARNKAAGDLFAILAEPLTKAEMASIKATGQLRTPGYVEFSTSGMGYGNAQKWSRWLKNNKKKFEEMGIPIPDKLTGEVIKAGGKAYKIPEKVARDLGALFDVQTGSTNVLRNDMVRMFDNAMGEILSTQIASNLTRLSTANRNLISQVTSGAPRALVNFYSAILQQVPSWRWEQMPEAALIGDFTAFGRAIIPGKSKALRARYPPEMVGQTFMSQWHQGPVSGRVGKMLKVNGFEFWDISAKRVMLEAGIEKGGLAAYHRAVRLGNVAKGESKAEFIRKYRANIPATVRAVAMREADTWGAYDYSNIPRAIAWLKQTKTGKGIVPFPTYIYKNWANLMTELGYTPGGLYGNLTRMMGQGKDPRAWRLGNVVSTDAVRKGDRVRAAANLMAGATIAGGLWSVLEDDGEISDEIMHAATRDLVKISQQKTGVTVKEQDISFQSQKFGRMQLPLSDEAKEIMGMSKDRVAWFRTYDQPLLGEMQAFKALYGNEVTLSDYMNDRVSMGSLVNGVMVLTDITNKYNKHLSRGSRTGDYLSNFVPFHNELQLARKFTDPTKRERSQEDAGFWKNMAMALSDQLPIMSSAFERDSFLPPRHRTFDDSVAKYPRSETLISYFLWNIRAIDSAERSAALSLAQLELMGDTSAALNRKVIKQLIRNVADADTGKTEIGQAKRTVASSETIINTRLEQALAGILMKRAYLQSGGGQSGAQAALAAGHEAIVEALDRGEQDMRGLTMSANRVLSTLMAGASEAEYEGMKFRGLEIRRLKESRKKDRPAILRELIRLRGGLERSPRPALREEDPAGAFEEIQKSDPTQSTAEETLGGRR